jgi:hypothetical protein
MRIRITSRDGYGDRFGVMHKYDEEWDAPDAIAVKVLRMGIAVPVREAPVERAVKAAPEHTQKRESARQRRPRKES